MLITTIEIPPLYKKITINTNLKNFLHYSIIEERSQMRDFTGGLTYVLSYFGMIYKKRGHGILKKDDTRAKKAIARAKLIKLVVTN